MRCMFWRALALGCVLAVAAGSTSRADQWPWHHTIPKETVAMDYRTGDVMRAPPIPYGEYAKDYVGSAYGAAGTAAGFVHGLPGHLAALCSKCGSKLCGLCGGLGHRNGAACGGCGGDGCGRCGSGLFGHGGGLLSHGGGTACGDPGCNGRHGLLGHGGKGGGLGHGHGHGGAPLCGPGMNCASGQSPVMAMGQGAFPSGQTVACGTCKGLGRMGNGPCGACGGRGLLGKLCGLCGGRGLGVAGPCGGCGGRGLLCGLCGGKGRLANGGPCGGCGQNGSNVCNACGGKGCSLCGGTGLIHALAGHVLGTAAGLFHHGGGVEYFVGPGGPVPLTPGYVPYVVPTRSPRDYFAFPPFTDQALP